MPFARSTPLVVALLVLAGALFPLSAQQDTTRGVRIGLTYQPGVKPGIIVVPVAGETGDSVHAILQRDLDFSDRVEVIGRIGTSAADALRQVGAGSVSPAVWRSLGAIGAVQATLTASGLRVALHDVRENRVAQSADFALPSREFSAEWRLALHGVADEVERWITGRRGIAQTRIAFVRGGRVHIVDSDGHGERAISDQGGLSPAWHPSGRMLVYSLMGNEGTRLLVHELSTGATRTLPGTARGLNITPEFSPDGRFIIYTHGLEAGTDIWSVDLTGGAPRRITVGRGTDNVSPSFSPDGRRIAFTSGRAGHPEVYTADADGSNVELLTPYRFGEQSYRSNPAWSPDGRAMAYQAQIDGRFQIMIMNLRDRSVRQLTSDGNNEDPSWAPDGRHVVFTSTRSGARQLWVLDIESGRTRQLTRSGGARLASWSRVLGESTQ